MSSLTILFGTQTGGAERLSYRIGRLAMLAGCESVRVLAADEVPVSSWVSLSPVLLVCSNANQGSPPLTFRRTWEALLTSSPSLQGLFFGVFGLGDSLYEKFNHMGKMLHNRLVQLDATPLILRGLGDESDGRGLEEVLEPWLQQLWSTLGWAVLQPPRLHAHAQQMPLFPLYRTKVLPPSTGSHPSHHPGSSSALLCGSSYFSGVADGDEEGSSFTCEVLSNHPLTSSGYSHPVHHLELAVPSLVQPPAVGDALGIWGTNAKQQVDAVLDALRYTGDEMVEVTLNTSLGPDGGAVDEEDDRVYRFSALPQRSGGLGSTGGAAVAIRTVMERWVDLEAALSQDFLWMLARLVDDSNLPAEDAEELKERLLELSDPGQPDLFLSYAYREKRNVVEALHDFKCIRVPLEYFLSFAPPMVPRFYSVSSSNLLDGKGISLTVGLLTWTTPMKRERRGLVSAALAASVPGSRFQSCWLKGLLVVPVIPMPIVCIATGTGIAPIRALIRELAGKAKTSPAFAHTPLYLFYGCRYQQQDFLYEKEWEQLRASCLPQLHVVPAFSRDQPTKDYVQHQMGKHAKALLTLLRSDSTGDQPPCVFYICGNAKSMPKDVGAVLKELLMVEACEDEVKAARRLRDMQSAGLLQVDTWSA